MREIVERLTENRQVELAKSILESNGYKVTKKSKRSLRESAVFDLNDFREDTHVMTYREHEEQEDPDIWEEWKVIYKAIADFLGTRPESLATIHNDSGEIYEDEIEYLEVEEERISKLSKYIEAYKATLGGAPCLFVHGHGDNYIVIEEKYTR